MLLLVLVNKDRARIQLNDLTEWLRNKTQKHASVIARSMEVDSPCHLSD
jgi:hypothetical protein